MPSFEDWGCPAREKREARRSLAGLPPGEGGGEPGNWKIQPTRGWCGPQALAPRTRPRRRRSVFRLIRGTGWSPKRTRARAAQQAGGVWLAQIPPETRPACGSRSMGQGLSTAPPGGVACRAEAGRSNQHGRGMRKPCGQARPAKGTVTRMGRDTSRWLGSWAGAAGARLGRGHGSAGVRHTPFR